MIYNRRKKREYFAGQKALAEAALQDAEVALRDGRATGDQIALLEQRVTTLENRIKALEAGANPEADIDISKVLVKPEDTAGTPPGWKL